MHGTDAETEADTAAGTEAKPPSRAKQAKAWAERQPVLGAALRVQERFSQLDGNGTATAVTVSVLLSIVPLLLVAIAVVGFVAEGRDLVPDIVERFDLGASGTEMVTSVLDTATRNAKASSIVGLLGLTWTALGVGAALQQVVNRTWQVTGRGLKDKAYSLVMLVVLSVILAASMAVTGLVNGFGGWFAMLSVPMGVALTAAAFLWMFWFLAPLRVPWRNYVPGAMFAAVAFEILKFLGGVLLPRLVANSTALYGSIGAVIGLLGFLLFFGRIVVYASVLNVVRYEAAHGTRTVQAEVPAIDVPGRVVVTRGLAVKVADATLSEPAG